MADKIWYLCNPLLNTTCSKKSCYFTGAWDSGCKYTSNIEFAIDGTPIDIKAEFRKEFEMSNSEKQNTLARLIFDAERRLGSYLASDGTKKEDAYAQKQIGYIKQWTKDLHDSLMDTEKETKQGTGTINDPYKYPKSPEQLQGIAIGSAVYFTAKAYSELSPETREMARMRGLQLIYSGGTF